MPLKGSGVGVHVHHKGYLGIVRRGPWWWWMVHRKVMYEACLEMCYYPLNGNLLEGFTVEHLDHNRQHNCRGNLMMLDKRIHDWLSRRGWQIVSDWRRTEAEAAAKAEAAVQDDTPDWVVDDA